MLQTEEAFIEEELIEQKISVVELLLSVLEVKVT